MTLPEIDRARLAESYLRVQNVALRQENARLALAAERAEAEERHRVVVEDIFGRHGLAVGRDVVDQETGEVRSRADAPAAPAKP